MSQTSDQMELRETEITAHYPMALAMLRGFDHAPRIGKAKSAPQQERSSGLGTRRRFRKARCRANHRKKAFSTAFRRATATRPLAPFPTPHPPRLKPRGRDTTTNRSPRSRVDPRRRRVRVFPPPGACVSAPQLMDILGAVRRY